MHCHVPRPTLRPRVRGALGAAPTTLLCLVVLLPGVWWAIDGGGYAIADWSPVALALVGLLVLAALTVPLAWRGVPRTVQVAVLALAAYAAWSFASMLWADDPGFALEGAGRTAAYAVVFALFALWPQRERSASWILIAWVGLMGIAGIVLALRLTQGADVTPFFNYGRLKEPAGYPNATAALLAMPVLPAVVLSAARGLPWWLRGLAAGSAVLLACLAVMTVSRGAVYFAPFVVLAMFALVPGRVALLFALLPVAAAVAVCTPRLLDVGDALAAYENPGEALDRALGLAAVTGTAVAVLVAGVALAATRRPPSVHAARRLQLSGRIVAACVVVAVVAGGLAVAGDPVDRIDSAWASFKGGYADNDQTRAWRSELQRWAEVAAAHRIVAPAGLSLPDGALKDEDDGAGELVDLRRAQLYRVFNEGRFDRGGRFYGGWWMGLSKAARASITIDGEPVVELDFKAFYPRLCYDLEGVELDPSIDPYEVPALKGRVDRKALKVALNQLIAVGPGVTPRRPQGANIPSRLPYRAVLEALETQHPAMRPWLRQARSLELQRIDSEIAGGVLRYITTETARPVLPIHDSFVVARRDEATLGEAMARTYRAVVEKWSGKGAWPVIDGWSSPAIRDGVSQRLDL